MDPNLVKIRDANMALIKQNRFGRAIVQGKSYLLYILGEDRMDQLNHEMDDFVDSMREIYSENSARRPPQAESHAG
jgi:hypothetical protein